MTQSITISDDLIAAFKAGDQDAFHDLYEQTKSFVYNVIFRMVKHQQEAEDLTHDIFVKVYEKRHLYNGSVKFTTWVYRVATNHVLNHLNRKTNLMTKLKQVFWEQPSYHGSDESSIDASWITADILEQIKPEFRICLVLKEMQDMSYEQIAETLQLNLGTVKSRLNRARQQFLKLYNQEVTYATSST